MGLPRTRLRRVAALVLVIGLAGLTSLRTFLVPLSSPPQRVDVVLVVGPIYTDTRLAVAQALVRRFPGAVLLVSVDYPDNCRGKSAPGSAAFICFRPSPFTTRGEAREAGKVVRARHLSSVLVVAPPDQLQRAQLRVQRCVRGPVLGIASPRSFVDVKSLFWYQNAAMIKAYLQRSC